MSAITSARRYAKGLLEIGKQDNSLNSLLSDMQLIANTLEASSELKIVLNSPVVRDEKKKDILKAVFDGKITNTTEKLFELLGEKNRYGILHLISKEFIRVYNQHAGILEVSISTAYDLEKGQVDSIVKAMEKTTGKTIKASVSTNKSLIGGVAIKYNDTVIDGSVKNKLERLAETMYV